MFNFLNKQETNDTPDIPQDNLANISFYVDKSNNVNIYCDWSADTEDNANILAKLLFGVHNGLYAGKTANIFGDEIKNNTENKDFLSVVILEWKKLNDIYQEEMNRANKQPIIRPSLFNQNVKQ